MSNRISYLQTKHSNQAHSAPEVVPVEGIVERRRPTLAELVPSGVPLHFPGAAATDFSGASTDGRLIELWLHRKSAQTRRAYISDLTKFFDFTESRPLAGITVANLQEFADFISGVLAPGSQARTLATVKSLLSYANRVGYLPFNVGAAIELPALKDDLAERELTEAEVHRMLNLEPGKRNRVILLTLYAGGLRREDVCNLKWRDVKARDDVRPGSGQVTVFGKGGKTGPVLLPPSVFEELLSLRTVDEAGEEISSLFSHDDPVFASRKRKTERAGHLDPSQINRIVSAAARRAGVEGKVSPHWLRHSHATHADRRGAPLALIKTTLRHSSIATTGRYLHANPSESSAMYLGL